MSKIKFDSLDKNNKKDIFQAISAETGMPPFAVEKDWWVTQTLAVIFEMDVAQHLVFKGGTSLSKAWKLIKRFSEDIDLAIDREFFGFQGELSKKKKTKLRKEAGKYTSEVFFNHLKEKFVEKELKPNMFKVVEAKESDQDPRIIEVYYENIIPSPDYYLEPKVQIEISCRSLKEPFNQQSFGSLVDELYSDQDFAEKPITIPTVKPERTFLEKIFLLHEEFQRPEDKIRVDRLSRHLYDVFHLSKTSYAQNALSDRQLYETIVEHRQKFSKVGGVDYNKHQPQYINPLPLKNIVKAWKSDYNIMLEQMIYESGAPTFEELLYEIETLKETINQLEWKFSKKFPVPKSK